MSLRRRLLDLLAVADHPEPPPGPTDSVATFRAARAYFWYTVLGWFPKQAFALFGLLASLAFFGNLDRGLVEAEGLESILGLLDRMRIGFGGLSLRPSSLLDLIEGFAIVAYLVQLVGSAAFLKLGWELRWYMVGDEALRIREGVWSVRERTMTIANIQNMSVRQGPVQRLMGIADLEVRTAGGGAGSGQGDPHAKDDAKSFHVGRFRGLEAQAARRLRDSLRQRLRRHRGSGLGDPDDVDDLAPVPVPEETTLLGAARSLRDEAAALRRALAGGGQR